MQVNLSCPWVLFTYPEEKTLKEKKDTVAQCLRLPRDKLDQLMYLLDEWNNKKKCIKQELQNVWTLKRIEKGSLEIQGKF